MVKIDPKNLDIDTSMDKIRTLCEKYLDDTIMQNDFAVDNIEIALASWWDSSWMQRWVIKFRYQLYQRGLIRYV